MLRLHITDEEREGKEELSSVNMAEYTNKSFGMFGGKEEVVTLLVKNSLAGVIIDRFGKDFVFVPEGDDHFKVNVKVMVSPQFLGWVISIGEGIKIIGPDSVVDKMKAEIDRLTKQYS